MTEASEESKIDSKIGGSETSNMMRKTREELITELKKTLNELFVNHHVASVQASADGIKIRVMEELNIPM
jgi:hypothetical protein